MDARGRRYSFPAAGSATPLYFDAEFAATGASVTCT